MKKTIAILLAAVLMLSAFSGCSISKNPYKDDPEAAEEILHPSPSPSPSAAPLSGSHDFAAAYALYEPDAVVATVNGLDVTWREYFYWCMAALMNVETYVGAISDFDEDFGGMSYGDYLKTAAENNCRQYRAVEYNAAKEGIELSADAEAAIAEQLQSDIANYSPDGTEQGLNDYLETIYTSRDIYDYVNRISMLYSAAFTQYCGENGEKVTDEETLSFGDTSGLMAAKHILLKTVEDDGSTALSDEVKSEKLALATELIARIDAGEDFDTLMAEYNEDPGSANYPYGYCFADGQMVTEFESAVKALSVDEMTSTPVESSFGYHIIKRVPFHPDMVYMGQTMTLRQMAANDKFNAIMNDWLDASEIVYADGFELDFNTAFNGK